MARRRAVSCIAIYGMFIAIIVPACRSHRPVLLVTVAAVGLSCLLAQIPGISSGFSIILCALAAAGLGAKLFPIQEAEKEEQEEGL